MEVRMVLETLFNKVNELNQALKTLGCERLYCISFVAQHSYEGYDCLKGEYTSIKDFIKEVEKETYFVNIENAVVEAMETGRAIDDLEYEVTFEGKMPNGEKFNQVIYAYLTTL